MSSTATSATDDGLVLPVIPNELFEYLYHQQHFMDDLNVPFVGVDSGSAVSNDTSFGNDVLISRSDNIFGVPGGGGGGGGGVGCYDTATGYDETIYLIPDLTETASPTASEPAATVIKPENTTNTNVDLSPKAAIAKQVKRRSRASRKTPTTLLNASIKNFRKLVQQYTSFQSSASGLNMNGKGPITLSFGAPTYRNDFPVPFGNHHYSCDQVDKQQTHYRIYGGEQGLMINSFVDF